MSYKLRYLNEATEHILYGRCRLSVMFRVSTVEVRVTAIRSPSVLATNMDNSIN